MSQPWWQTRDPDLGRDRDTKALGRRDYNWFTAYTGGSGVAPADFEPASSPWGSHAVTVKDRYDRTLGIPSRHISMWSPTSDLLTPHQPATDLHSPDTRVSTARPLQQPGVARHAGAAGEPAAQQQARREAADQVMDHLLAQPPLATPAQASPRVLARMLDAVAPAVHGRSKTGQYAAITGIAAEYGMSAGSLHGLARDTGTLIAKTTHAPAPSVPGDPNLNRLLHADRNLAAELLLARARLAWDQVHSDPDLPRLWILTNGLHHGVPAHILLNQPAISRGPAAHIVPERDDLIGWRGIAAAVTQLRATTTAAQAGRHWLAGTTSDGAAHDRILALGVLALTHPAHAHELAVGGPAAIRLDRLRDLAAHLPIPDHPIDLSDAGLKSVCDRNNWLLGTADERTQRELVERHAPAALARSDVRAGIAAGRPRSLSAAVMAGAPTDTELDAATWRSDPPAPDATQRRQLLDLASRQALHEFAGYDITPHPTRAAALAGRLPQRFADRGLIATADQLLLTDPLAPDLEAPAQLELEL